MDVDEVRGRDFVFVRALLEAPEPAEHDVVVGGVCELAEAFEQRVGTDADGVVLEADLELHDASLSFFEVGLEGGEQGDEDDHAEALFAEHRLADARVERLDHAVADLAAVFGERTGRGDEELVLDVDEAFGVEDGFDVACVDRELFGLQADGPGAGGAQQLHFEGVLFAG